MLELSIGNNTAVKVGVNRQQLLPSHQSHDALEVIKPGSIAVWQWVNLVVVCLEASLAL
ncbi:MAG TPA: hypothetical protein V6D34_15285 [Candidatus Sericytochromatia bacterium]